MTILLLLWQMNPTPLRLGVGKGNLKIIWMKFTVHNNALRIYTVESFQTLHLYLTKSLYFP